MTTILQTSSPLPIVAASPAQERTLPRTLEWLLAQCESAGASDLHLAIGRAPQLRVHGDLQAIADEPPLSIADLDTLTDGMMNAVQRQSLNDRGSADGACSSVSGARFRFNIFRSQSHRSVVLRQLDSRFRSLAELGMPEELYRLSELPDGLVVVSGPTGAGKSTTLATLLDKINQKRRCHMITIEDPIEYVHVSKQAHVNQRELHTDVPDFNEALVASLRQDPDVILVGEIRELKTIRTAITAAETGHLVFTTVHAGDCVGTIERLVGVFPADEQDGIRRQVSLVLRAIVNQQLLPAVVKQGKKGRVATSEVLVNTPAVANLIALGKSNQIYSAMETGRGLGMQTLEQDIARLWVTGRITEQTAIATCRNVPVMRERAALLRRGG